MDPQAFYYFFSTIPQVLAGAIALLGAFVLYRLQGMDTDMRTESNSAMFHLQQEASRLLGKAETLEPRHKLYQLLGDAKYSEFLVELAAFMNRSSVQPFSPDTANQVARLQSNITLRNRLIHTLKVSLVLTAVVILVSVACIGAMAWLPCDVMVTLGAAVGAGFAVCLGFYVYLVRMSV